jgi:putative nucleotidyltransferase with HDIG domain
MGPQAQRARDLARSLLADALPRRWAHSQGVAARAESLAPIVGQNADLLQAAAWLHDIGYSPTLATTGFHPLDGARYLRDVEHADDRLCRLVAHHSCACIEAEARGLRSALSDEFPADGDDLTAPLIYCDMTTDPDGRHVTYDERLSELLSRYGENDIVTRSMQKAAPAVRDAIAAVEARLADP